uniref:AMP-binding protein n=2 Tax=Nocardiaceae TaxID=85025 RepID=UPI0020BE298D
TIHTLGHRLHRILTTIATNPHTPIGDIDILDHTERERITAVGTPSSLPPSTPTAGTALTQALVAAVEDDPDAPALVSGDEELSYHDLETRSSRLARVLIARGCGPGAGVAVRLDRGLEAVIATWAVLKTGAALVPVDALDTPLPDHLEIKIGLTLSGTRSGAGVDWLSLDDPAVVAEIAAESPRPVTYAHRTHLLRGSDPAFIGERVLSYDDLATAAAQLRTRDELTYESEVLYRDPGSSDTLIELVAGGTVGASVVLGSDGEVPAGEW